MLTTCHWTTAVRRADAHLTNYTFEGYEMLSVFDQHRVTITTDNAADQLAAALARDGLATFDGVFGRGETLRLAGRLLLIVEHRDSDPDGVTFIADRGELARKTGYAGFGTGSLAPHTDGSALRHPPEVVLLVCARPGISGGESLIIDGRAVHADLRANNPDLLGVLDQPHSAYFGTGPSHLGSVFEHPTADRVSLRLRLDELARFTPAIDQRLPELHDTIARHTMVLPLEAGQGYVLANHRMLHGRRAFTGGRAMYRVLGDPLPEHAIPRGFAPTALTPAR
ncbi:TauD/TfdA family dioxygenase [Longispora sp. K20-0274]|uniref:TauD/TfdA family dioxygenase n=1 Tax=Longispora sp. K20-0274 TaxID=3088255 RepID=UPI00399BD4EB